LLVPMVFPVMASNRKVVAHGPFCVLPGTYVQNVCTSGCWQLVVPHSAVWPSPDITLHPRRLHFALSYLELVVSLTFQTGRFFRACKWP